ncbi:UDP-2,3-diacylglucosamine diphosphatase [Porphyromonas sp.]|uniref:UDP-2,3-diacylglucosamine diphosphatase n=1 Tax=Porphyromonas sp. TaxID=1924944 RepID=UPI0026DC8562|nr:UDP-2,3-diacylglucosamine diphosphatase [Porphyromonas sp.]MDO4695838.1 UDP-2,3-diacylglucosamine diphosphatase [Porphyromonas sp.]MDO4771404.1 UDP-2,3-diacylglucosamine diphosphatase [Porphyromonas sp.]
MKKTYFISDIHLGSPIHEDPKGLEKRLVSWLEMCRTDAKAIYLVGDIFDYWFEYKYVVPKGFVRLLGTLASLSDEGVEIHIFTGNHDVWMFDYLESEVGATIHRTPTLTNIDGVNFYIAHGDEFDYTKKGFRIVRKIFHSRICQRLYAMIHPRWSVGLAHALSLKSRKRGLKLQGHKLYNEYQGEKNEYLVHYAQKYLKENQQDNINFFIFGHRHIMLDLMMSRDARIVVLGDWLTFFSYGVWDGEHFYLDQYSVENT